jgi:hypothetical protein
MATFAESIRFCTSRDGTRIAYAISGNGPPIIRLAGLFTHLEFDRMSSIWRPWIASLEKGRQLIRYDARGSGMSDCDAVKFSFEHYIEDLEAVAAATGLCRFALFGIVDLLTAVFLSVIGSSPPCRPLAFASVIRSLTDAPPANERGRN